MSAQMSNQAPRPAWLSEWIERSRAMSRERIVGDYILRLEEDLREKDKDTKRLDEMQRMLTLNGEFGAIQLYCRGSLTFTAANVGAKGSHATIREAIDDALGSTAEAE